MRPAKRIQIYKQVNMNDFIKEGLKVGDRLYSLNYGWCTVSNVFNSYTTPFCIVIKDDKTGACHDVDANGRINDKHNQSVFWGEPKFEIPQRPKREVVKEIDVFVNYNSQYHNHTESFRDIYEAEINADSNCPHIAIPGKLTFTILE